MNRSIEEITASLKKLAATEGSPLHRAATIIASPGTVAALPQAPAIQPSPVVIDMGVPVMEHPMIPAGYMLFRDANGAIIGIFKVKDVEP